MRNKALFALLLLLLTGCIQPDALDPDVTPTLGSIGGTSIFPPTLAGGLAPTPNFGSSGNATQTPGGESVATIAPLPTFGAVANTPDLAITGTAEPQAWVWKFANVGPEQVAVMFFQDKNGRRCARYIYRNKVLERCPQSGQSIVTVAGIEVAADAKPYTIIAGRALDRRVTVVTIEFQDGSSEPIPVVDGGYLAVESGIKPVKRAVPVDQFGNLVGAVVPVT